MLILLGYVSFYKQLKQIFLLLFSVDTKNILKDY